MQILSLFNGMSVASQALKEINVKPEKTYVSDIDKWANDNTRYNHPDSIHVGDVTKWREWNIDWSKIDLVVAGSPCQGFSFAGKQLAFDDPRSALFFEFLQILNYVKQHNPDVKFMLENVKMKKEFLDTITNLLKADPILINSALVTAQNRQRYYWTKEDIAQPEDLGIMLKDILQEDNEVDSKYFLSEEQINKIDFTNINKTFKSDVKVLGHRKGFRRNTQCFDPTGKTECLDTCTSGGRQPHVLKINKKGKIKSNQNKASCLTGGGHSGGNHSDMDIIAKGVAQRGRYNEEIATSDKDIHQLKCDSGYQDNKVGIKKSPTLRAGNSFVLGMDERFFIRRLTPTECERLQGLPDGYTKYGRKEDGTVYEISDTQRYKMLGNGWTLPVIKHIFKQILGE